MSRAGGTVPFSTIRTFLRSKASGVENWDSPRPTLAFGAVTAVTVVSIKGSIRWRFVMAPETRARTTSAVEEEYTTFFSLESGTRIAGV
jgi:hypothetical protein